MKSFFLKHYINFCQSSKFLKLKYLYWKIFKEKNIGSLNLDFSNKPNRIEIVQYLIKENNFRNYLEIGCFKNELFNKIECENKVGVDPQMGGTIRKTSDDFFKQNNKKFDLIFIDGLHMYYQVKKDLENSFKCINDNGIIILHDCLPNTVYDQAVPRCKLNWNGDVWKAIVETRTLDNFDTYTCYADQGLGIIFNRPNKNILKINNDNYRKLKFAEYYENYKEFTNLITFEELKKINFKYSSGQ